LNFLSTPPTKKNKKQNKKTMIDIFCPFLDVSLQTHQQNQQSAFDKVHVDFEEDDQSKIDRLICHETLDDSFFPETVDPETVETIEKIPEQKECCPDKSIETERHVRFDIPERDQSKEGSKEGEEVDHFDDHDMAQDEKEESQGCMPPTFCERPPDLPFDAFKFNVLFVMRGCRDAEMDMSNGYSFVQSMRFPGSACKIPKSVRIVHSFRKDGTLASTRVDAMDLLRCAFTEKESRRILKSLPSSFKQLVLNLDKRSELKNPDYTTPVRTPVLTISGIIRIMHFASQCDRLSARLLSKWILTCIIPSIAACRNLRMPGQQMTQTAR